MNKVHHPNNLPQDLELDTKVRLQDDFYGYVCNGWLRDHPRPATKPRWGSFDELAHRVEAQIIDMVEDWCQSPKKLDQDKQQAVNAYQAILNKNQHTRASLTTLTDFVGKLKQKPDKPLSEVLAIFADSSIFGFIQPVVAFNRDETFCYCLDIYPADLDLHNRDYYLSKQADFVRCRRDYLSFLEEYQAALVGLGIKDHLSPTKILEIETAIAKLTWPLAKLRDSKRTHNIYSYKDLCKDFEFNWGSYFKAVGIPSQTLVNVQQPSYLKGVLGYLNQLERDELFGYLLHKLYLNYGGLINQYLEKIHFNFFFKKLLGTKQMKTKKERAVESINNHLVDIIGKAYVEKHFPKDCRDDVRTMAAQVAQAFKQRLATNTWMSPKSIKFAGKKLDNIIVNVGYSGVWPDYSPLSLKPDNPMSNQLKVGKFNQGLNFDLLSRRPNRARLQEPLENAQAVNAWTYHPLLNTCYPAAILQPPFYDRLASWAYNIGSLGTVIGHELSHQFDDQGAHYDDKGRLKTWLAQSEQAAFHKASQKILDQLEKYRPAPGIKLKPKQVIGELIADLCGLEVALDTVKAKYKDQQTQLEAIRHVLIGYSLTFGGHQTRAHLIKQVRAHVHPDNRFRVVGILPHCDDFYRAFDVKEGDKMYLAPELRAKIW